MHKFVNELFQPREWQCGTIEYAVRRLISATVVKRFYRPLFRHHPWFVPQATWRLARNLNAESEVFEWGSGFGTLWLARRVGALVSIEHDLDWFKTVTRLLADAELNNTSVKHRPVIDKDAVNTTPSISSAVADTSSELRAYLSKPEYLDYVGAIDEFPDGTFDCVIIDGRERMGCLKLALPKLRIGGLLVLDDAHRSQYQEAFSILHDWDCQVYSLGIDSTAIFEKPVSE